MRVSRAEGSAPPKASLRHAAANYRRSRISQDYQENGGAYFSIMDQANKMVTQELSGEPTNLGSAFPATNTLDGIAL